MELVVAYTDFQAERERQATRVIVGVDEMSRRPEVTHVVALALGDAECEAMRCEAIVATLVCADHRPTGFNEAVEYGQRRYELVACRDVRVRSVGKRRRCEFTYLRECECYGHTGLMSVKDGVKRVPEGRCSTEV
jgi:hypothetical protein